MLKSTMNQISNLKKLNYLSPVFIMGSAPSLRFFKGYQQLNGIRIGVGDVPWRAKEFRPYDYWVTANASYPLPWNKKHFKHLLNSNAQIVLSSASANLAHDINEVISKMHSLKLQLPITFYNQRHFRSIPCSPKNLCCYFADHFVTDPSIQEILSDSTGGTGPAYSEGDSVTLHALALAIILQAKEIYIVGVEIPQIYKHYTHYKDYKNPFENPIDFFKRKVKRTLPKYQYRTPAYSHDQIQFFKDFQKIVNIATRTNIKIYSISPTSPINYMTGVNRLYV
jgi:hypothetical protein